jgi:CspA family cold shock protein
MAQGTIKKIVSDKGFGFISGDKGDVFFHHSAVADRQFDSLQVGQAVQYDVEQGNSGKGPRAVNVKPVG